MSLTLCPEDCHSIHADAHDRLVDDDKKRDGHTSKRSLTGSNPYGDMPKVNIPDERPTKRIKLVYRRPNAIPDSMIQASGIEESDTVTVARGGVNKIPPASRNAGPESLRKQIETLRNQNAQYAKVNEDLLSKFGEMTCKLEDFLSKDHGERDMRNRELRVLKMEKKILWECGIEWARREQLWAIERQLFVERIQDLTSRTSSMMTISDRPTDIIIDRSDDTHPHAHPSLN